MLADKLGSDLPPKVLCLVFLENVKGRSRTRQRIKWHSGWDTPKPINLDMSRALWRRIPLQKQNMVQRLPPQYVPRYTIPTENFVAMLDGHIIDDARVHDYGVAPISPLSDQTPLATFLGFNNEDNEVVKAHLAGL